MKCKIIYCKNKIDLENLNISPLCDEYCLKCALHMEEAQIGIL